LPDGHAFVARSHDDREIRLTNTIWRKIQEHHPEFAQRDYTDEISRAISDPDYIVEGWGGGRIALALCVSAPVGAKHIAVVYRELNGDGFIITAFFISRFERLLKRGILWQRT
jgi:hypothetical protein